MTVLFSCGVLTILYDPALRLNIMFPTFRLCRKFILGCELINMCDFGGMPGARQFTCNFSRNEMLRAELVEAYRVGTKGVAEGVFEI